MEEIEALSSQAALRTDSSNSPSSDDEVVDKHTNKNKANTSSDSGEICRSKRDRINVLSPGLTTVLDRTKVSSRNATFILSEVASSLGYDVNTLNINRNSIQRARASHRAARSNSLRSEFSSTVPVTVHWDGKLMEDLSTHEHVDLLQCSYLVLESNSCWVSLNSPL